MPQPEEEREQPAEKAVLILETEIERLKKDVYRSDVEKFHLFTQMLRANKLYKDAKVTHK